MEKAKPTFFYKEPRLSMTSVGRFVVRLVSYFTYGLLIAASLITLLSDISILRAFGALLALFLLDRLVHANLPERPLARVSINHLNTRLYLPPASYRLIEIAFERTLLSGGDFYLRILGELVRRREIRKILIRLDIKPKEFSSRIDEYITQAGSEKTTKKKLKVQAEKLVLVAFKKSVAHYGSGISAHEIFGALGEMDNSWIKKMFTLFDINPSDLESAFLFGNKSRKSIHGFISRQHKRRGRTMNRSWTAKPTRNLDQYSSDYTSMAASGVGGLMVGHKGEYERLENVLSRPGSPNALLVGDPGAGKDILVRHLAFQVIKDRVSKPLFDRRVVALSVSSFAAGGSVEEVQGRLKSVLAEILDAGNVILYIPDIHNLLKTSETGGLTGADILLPIIQQGNFSVVGSTTPQDYAKYIESNNTFAELFEQIKVEEINENEAVQYLVYLAMVLELESKITISFSAIKEAARLAKRYFHQKLLPGSAEDLLKETIAGAVNQKKKIITADDIIYTAEQKTNVIIHDVKEGEAKKLLNLEEDIHKHFIDQDEAVKAVANALRQYRSGLSRKGGPIASFLFVGPTGVGKTELSKILAKIQFGNKNSLKRFDMSEYQDKQSFFRLIGSPDGSTKGDLTETVINQPYSLILLDEFEKAYPDILSLFLQVFDDGRLTDNVGRTVDFTNTIIIATSNAHSTLILEEVKKGAEPKTIADMLKNRLTEYFKPELINRFSDIVVFKSLSPEDILSIARLNLAELVEVLNQEHAAYLIFDESAVKAIATLGYDPVFGARPLRKVISERLRSVLAEKILKGEIEKGGSIRVAYDNDQFVFS